MSVPRYLYYIPARYPARRRPRKQDAKRRQPVNFLLPLLLWLGRRRNSGPGCRRTCRSRGRRRTCSAASRGSRRTRRRRVLIVEVDNLLRDVDAVRGIQHRRLRRADVQDQRIAVVLGVLVDHRHDPAAQFVHDLLLFLAELGLRILGISVQRLGFLIDIAHQLLPGLFAQRVTPAVQLILQLADLALAPVEIRLLGSEPALDFASGLLAVLSAHDRALDVDDSVLTRGLRTRGQNATQPESR